MTTKDTKKNKGGVIYSLSDDGGVKYIGQTKVPRKRFNQHCSLAQNRGNRKVNKWLYALLSNGELPIINILEYTDNLNKREIYWVKLYKERGINLLNMTRGGFDWKFLKQKKLEKPWGHTHSPIQSRLKNIRETIRFSKKRGNVEWAQNMEKRLVAINNKIKEIGLERFNLLLWEKYGR